MIPERVKELGQELYPKLDKLTKDLYDNPELADEEYFASNSHCDLLREYGFTVEENFCGKATGFRAVYDTNKPGLNAAFLAEYDALPGIGHGCGHNILGAVSSGAGIILKHLIGETGGKVTVLGTPAEESNGAKPHYIENGVFDGIDLVLMAHPADAWYLSGSSQALIPLQFEFFGKSAHAASAPEMGQNALDAGVITYTAVNALKGHIARTSSVAGVILEGGKAPNIVPDYCLMRYYVRSADRTYNVKLAERIKDCAKAGASATGTYLEITKFEPEFINLLTNETLSGVYKATALEEFGLDISAKRSFGSGDIGNVSHVCPTINPYFDISGGEPCPGHSTEKAFQSVTDYAYEQAHKAALLLALTAFKCMSGPALYKAVRDEFEKSRII